MYRFQQTNEIVNSDEIKSVNFLNSIEIFNKIYSQEIWQKMRLVRKTGQFHNLQAVQFIYCGTMVYINQ